jgi:1,4-alpha-glucan branching enzyme
MRLKTAPMRGYLSLILHAHLPYVRHPEYEEFYEERWLFEALSETYLPLLALFERLALEGIRYRITLSLSPTLTAMLQDPLLQQRYRTHVDKLLALCAEELRRNQGQTRILAAFYRDFFAHSRALFETYQGNILQGFARLATGGYLELITCAATHAYLPLWRQHPSLIRAQIHTACDSHRALFDTTPQGLWLPECGYYPGLETPLKAAGINYFMVDAHTLHHASEEPHRDTYAPLRCPNGVAVFARDPACSQQVWSAASGYPGDPEYRDFYRDIGFDLPLAHISAYLPGGHQRLHTGLKYHAVSSKNEAKNWYDPQRARVKAALHAADFYQRCVARIRACAPTLDRPPLLSAPYDAELFGHWWFEGPQWLEYLIRRCHSDSSHALELITPSDYLARHGENLQIAVPSSGSWGEEGYHRVWLNPANDWLYPPLFEAAHTLRQLAASVATQPQRREGVTQAGRELLLAQASDWAFILKNGHGSDYARQRITTQLQRFHTLTQHIDTYNAAKLAIFSANTPLFPNLDYRLFT